MAPVPKPSGKADDPNDYRGIAVGAVLAKLYSLCLMARLDAWAEKEGLRAVGQAGFRSGRSPTDNCFVLRHLVNAAACNQAPLFVAFIDFSKAYDRIDRALLWRVLEGAGLHGPMLETLQQMYREVHLRVRAKGELGAPFESTVGVKQGCPLSPLLFGIFIDRLEKFLAVRCPADGAKLADVLVRALLYADDIALVSESAEGLRRMLAALDEFCGANSMFVNHKKSEVVVFNSGGQGGGVGTRKEPPKKKKGQKSKPGSGPKKEEAINNQPGPVVQGEWGGFELGGVPLKQQPHYKYLGLMFEDGGTPRQMLTRAIDKARAGMRTMFGKCYKLNLHNANVQGHLFDSLIKPLLCYGCEVWGPDVMSAAVKSGGSNLASGAAEVEVHKAFMRQSLGVGLNTPSAALMHELGRRPTMVFWLRMAAQLWNRALKRDASDYLVLALRDNVELARGRGLDTKTAKGLWAHHFLGCLDELGVPWGGVGAMVGINPGALVKTATASWEKHENHHLERAKGAEWMGEALAVRAAPEGFSDGFMALTYRQWFGADTWVRKESFTFHLDRSEDIRAVARMRLGMHCLGIREGRLAGQRRSQRVCELCGGGVEDEMHMMMECPAYGQHREANTAMCAKPEGGWTDSEFRERMNGGTCEHWVGLARFIRNCLGTRAAKLVQREKEAKEKEVGQNSAGATN